MTRDLRAGYLGPGPHLPRPEWRQQDVTSRELHSAAAQLVAEGFRVALVAAHEDDDAFRVVYLFTAGAPDRRVELTLRTERTRPSVPSLAAVSFPAGRFEREMRDLYGIVPLGHPLPRRMIRHDHWPQGWYPMRSDAGPPPPFSTVEGEFPFLRIEGPGVYEIPVGPVHAGLIEPGHFRFTVVGETILRLKARLWFVHRGIEKLAEGRTPTEALALAERVSGDTAVGHTLAFCLAVEDALGLRVSDESSALRAILLELERLHNHVADLGALCNDVGFGIANAHALRVREQLLRLNKTVTGHRLLRGAILPGGARAGNLPDPEILAGLGADIADTFELALRNNIVRDRFAGTAILTCEQAHDTGALGYVARASGLDIDARRDHPFHPLTATVPSAARQEGDVLARALVRMAEIDHSVTLLRALVDRASAGSQQRDLPQELGISLSGVGLVEGWRGTITHRIELGPDARLTRWKIVDPSFLTWPALPLALADTIVPDFPLVNKSFNLSYAGNDL
jgi:Ni,Fe-hydrogenase III large subunit/Ni,Fe-hydrogenase III component G